MAEKDVIERAHRDAQEGKSPSTQAGEFVREEIEHVREGKHGARSAQQAIAIGLSKARRAGIKLPPPTKGRTSQKVRRQAQRDLSEARSRRKKKPSVKRSRATSNALRRESRGSVSHAALSRQARSSARRRGSAERHRAARAAVRAKGRTGGKRPPRKQREPASVAVSLARSTQKPTARQRQEKIRRKRALLPDHPALSPCKA